MISFILVLFKDFLLSLFGVTVGAGLVYAGLHFPFMEASLLVPFPTFSGLVTVSVGIIIAIKSTQVMQDVFEVLLNV
jgi:hypothetical protein